MYDKYRETIAARYSTRCRETSEFLQNSRGYLTFVDTSLILPISGVKADRIKIPWNRFGIRMAAAAFSLETLCSESLKQWEAQCRQSL